MTFKLPPIPSSVKFFLLTVLAVGIFFGLKWLFQGGIRLDADSDMLMTRMIEGSTMIYRTKYRDPDSFQEYVFVYDPKEVYFDKYSVNYTRQNLKLNSGMKDNKGVVFPDDPSKRMISLPRAANAPGSYRQPKGSRDGNFLVNVIAQFFYTPRGDSDELARFQAIASKGRFMVKKDGKYVDVRKSPRRYR